MKKRLLIKTLSLVITMILLLEAFPYSTETKAYNSDSDRVIVSLGDSFSSGEGLGDYYNTYLDKKNKETPIYDKNTPIEEKVTNEDWLAHRSTLSWPGRLTLNGVDGTMADNRNTHWFFAAVSGAETKHLNTKQQAKKYNRDHGRLDNSENPTKLPLQLDVFNTLKSKNLKADYVTITIGGNDAGFTDIISDTVISHSSYLYPGVLTKRINQTTAKFLTYDLNDTLTINPNLTPQEHLLSNFEITNVEFAESGSIYTGLCQAYEDIHKAAGDQAKIIVAGYPKLLNNAIALTINSDEVELINNAVSLFNYGIEKLVTRYQETENMPIHFVTVEKAFEGKEAYALNSAIYKIDLTPEKEDLDDRIWTEKGANPSARSMHPNDKGAEIYAECVQDKINELEKQDANNNTTTQTTTQQQSDNESNSFYNDQFYQQQQHNMQTFGESQTLINFRHDEDTLYYEAYETEFGKWLKSADDISALKFSNGVITNSSTDNANISICFSDSVAITDSHIYYINSGQLCRIKKDKKTNAIDADNWSPNWWEYDQEYIYKGNNIKYIISKKFIFILDGSDLICANHDGTNQKIIASGINPPLNWLDKPTFRMFTISENLYYVSNGKLYCYYSSPNKTYELCKIEENIDFMCASGDKLYFKKTEVAASDDFTTTYAITIYQYTEAATSLTEYSTVKLNENTGSQFFASPDGKNVYLGSYGWGGTTIYKVDLSTETINKKKYYKAEIVDEASYAGGAAMYIYKNSIGSINADFSNDNFKTLYTF
ncbi:MAG: hypothetical protein IJ289_01760 [Clostridia bacterium]|nr:hypothetical protein [Clostridia bacterium]